MVEPGPDLFLKSLERRSERYREPGVVLAGDRLSATWFLRMSNLGETALYVSSSVFSDYIMTI